MILTLLLISSAAASTCGFKANQIISYEEAEACLKTLNTSFSEQEKVVTALKKYIKLSANRDTIQYPPFASIDPIDLETELTKIQKKTNVSAIEFYSNISNLFKQLRDPHTLFLKPCAGFFTFVLPYGLIAEGSRSNPKNIKLKLNSNRGVKLNSVTQRYLDDIQDAVSLNGRQIVHLSEIGTRDQQFLEQQTSAQELSLWAEREIYASKFSAARFTHAVEPNFSIRQTVIDQIPPTKNVKLWLKQEIPDPSELESEFEQKPHINQNQNQEQQLLLFNNSKQQEVNEEQYDIIYLPFYAIVNQDIDGDDLSVYCPIEEDKVNKQNNKNNQQEEQKQQSNLFTGLKYSRIIEDMNEQLINDNNNINKYELQQSQQSSNDDPPHPPVHSGEGILFYIITEEDKSKTGFVRIASFYPTGKQSKNENQIEMDINKYESININNINNNNTSINPAVEKFVEDIQIGTNILVQNQIERLVIDVRGNQGGYGELASRILRYLTGQKGTDEELKKADEKDNKYYINYNNNVFPLMGEFDSPKSKLHTLLHKYQIFPENSEKMKSNIAENEQRKIIEKRKWYQIGTVRKEFGKENEKQNTKEMNNKVKAHYSLYTTKFTRERTEEEYSWDKQVYSTINKGSQLNIKEKNIIFLTDGLCYGACSMFLQRASELGIGKTVFVGQSPLDISSQDENLNKNKEIEEINGQQEQQKQQKQSINSNAQSSASIISSPGSFVTDSVYLQELRQYVKNNKKLSNSAKKKILNEFPLPFPRKGTSFRFPYEEVFGLKEKGSEININTDQQQNQNLNSFKYSTFSNNLAYTPIPPDFTIQSSFPALDEYVYSGIYALIEFDLKPIFETCVNWEVDEDDDKCKGRMNADLKPAPNAIYGHPCVSASKQAQQQDQQQTQQQQQLQSDSYLQINSSSNSQFGFDQNKCVFARCMNGHFLVNDPGKRQRVSTNTTWRPICEPIQFIDTSALGITKDAQSYMFTERTTESDVALFDKISWVFIIPFGIVIGIISGCLWVLFVFRDGWKRRTQERKGYTEIASDVNQGFDGRVNQGAEQSSLELRGVGNSVNATQSD